MDSEVGQQMYVAPKGALTGLYRGTPSYRITPLAGVCRPPPPTVNCQKTRLHSTNMNRNIDCLCLTQLHVNVIYFKKNYLDNEIQRKFTKREERESDDNSVPLADVIATSDVNSTADQTETVKKDVIQHAVDEKRTKNDVAFADESNDGKEKRESSVRKADLTPNLSQKQNAIDGPIEQSAASTYSEFLQDNKIPKNVEKHSSVEHMNDDDMEMNENLQKSSSSKDTKKFQDSMKTDELDTLSGSERNNDRMEDSKADDDSMESNDQSENESEDQSENESDDKSEDQSEDKSEDKSGDQSEDKSEDQSENESEDQSDDKSEDKSEDQSEDQSEDKSGHKSEDESGDESEDEYEDESGDDSEKNDKSMDDNEDAKNTDDLAMDSEDDAISGKNIGKQSNAKLQSKTSKPEDFLKSAGQSDMDDIMNSGKSLHEQTGDKVEFKTKSKQDFSNKKEMDDSDEEHTTENTNDSSGPEESDSMEPGKNLFNDTKEDEDTEITQEKDTRNRNSEEHSLDSTEDSNGSQENSQNNGLESTGDPITPSEDKSDFKTSSMGTDTESTKINSETTINSKTTDDSENKDEFGAAEHGDHLLSDENSGSKTENENNVKNIKEGIESDSDTGNGIANKAEDNVVNKVGDDSQTNVKEVNTPPTDSTSEDNSVIKIGDETNAKGLNEGSADIDSISGDNSELNELKTVDSVSEDAPGADLKVTTGSKPRVQNNIKTFDESMNTDRNNDADSSEEDQNLEKNNKDVESNNLDTGSSLGDSNIENTSPKDDGKGLNTIENNDNQNEVNSNEVNSDAGTFNLKHVHNKQNMFKSTSKPGRTDVSAAMNGKENNEGEMKEEKNSANKDEDAKTRGSGKIIETSYRFNDEDAPDDEDYVDQGKRNGGFHHLLKQPRKLRHCFDSSLQ